MYFRCIGSAFVAALVVGSGAGCKKSEPGPSAPPPVETVARVHWLGKKRLAGETNAASFMDIWNLPASAKLGAQTLDKLSLAPWRLLKGDAATNGAPSARLRTLLDDLVQEESYLEMRAATNQPGELAFAIRLSPERGGVWETNLGVVLESLTGVRLVAATGDRRGWSLKKHDAPNLVELTRVGDWTVIGLAQEQNALLGEMRERIERDHAPFAARATNFWLEAGLDLREASRVLSLGCNLPEDLPKISVAVIGDGGAVLTRGRLDFPKPQSFELEPWNFPTNLVRGPLIGFTAVRGIKPWLASLKMWKDLQLGAPPNQYCAWAKDGFPLQTYFAAPLRDANRQVNDLAGTLVQRGNLWLATNGMGRFERLPRTNGVFWGDLPIMQPFLRASVSNAPGFAFGGLIPYVRTNQPVPAEMLQAVFSRTNLISYDWEITQDRVEAWLFIGQNLRLVLHQAQLPSTSAGMAWLKSAALKLGNSITGTTKTGPAQISFVRSSGIGLTAVELNLLADWLESPRFPVGLHSFLAPPEAVVTRPSPGPAKPGKPKPQLKPPMDTDAHR
jgi:hypothetical protein